MAEYDYSDLWDIDSLNEEDKEIAIDVGCELGKTYKGPVEAPIEALYCPYCNVLAEDGCCKHLVYEYDGNDFSYLSKEYFNKIYSETKKNSHLIDEIFDDNLKESLENNEFETFYVAIGDLDYSDGDFEILTEGKIVKLTEVGKNILPGEIMFYSFGFYEGDL